MKSFSISQFKAHALAIVQAVHDTGQGVVVTKRGKPLVQVMPYRPDEVKGPFTGRLSGTLAFEGDLVSPLAGPQPRVKTSPESKERGR